MVNFGAGTGSDDGKRLFGRAVLHVRCMEFSAARLLNLSSGQQPSEDRPPTAGLMRVERASYAAADNGSRGLCLLADSKGRAFGPSK